MNKMNLFNCTFRSVKTFRHLSTGRSPKIQGYAQYAWRRALKGDASLAESLNKSIPSECKWKELRQQFLAANSGNERTVDAFLVNACMEIAAQPETALELTISYLNYLRTNNYKVNIAVANRTMAMYEKCGQTQANHEELILWLHDNVYKKYPVLDETSANLLVKALCKTQRWQEADAYMSLCFLNGLSTFAATCFQHDQPETGWKYLNKIKENYSEVYSLGSGLIKEYIHYCKRNFNGEALHREMSTLATFCREFGCVFTLEAADEVVEHSPVINYNAERVSIGYNGICPSCNVSLLKAELNEEEYVLLQKYTLENIIVAKNIYKGTNPKELKSFISFVDKNGPYDYVIDGLNLYYSTYHKNIVPELIKKIGHMKVLIISRFHLKKQLRTLEDDPNVFTYYVDNLTKDDAFILYAALKSGLHCKIISNDLMRTQKFLLPTNELRNVFKKWQIKNHLRIRTHKKSRQLFIHPVIKFPVEVNEDPEGWHIPWMTQSALHDFYTTWHDWICLRK